MSFRNPIIPGFHPDPSVCRVGDEYFLVTSSFTYFPGVPIFRSRNLVDWEQIGNVLDRPSQLDLGATAGWISMGIYAPTIRHHDGRFWMITTCATDLGGTTFFVTTDDPAGPWTDPVRVGVAGIDPDLAWDEEGRCWVHVSGDGGIVRVGIEDSSGEVVDGPDLAWAGTGLAYPEAPHLFERKGIWYLLIAEGGTERGHAVSIARSPSPLGPWEPCPANPILSHRSTDQPIQNTGHADLLEAADGSWWMVLLGVRPRGVTPGFHVLGRETFLASLAWVDGWPAVGAVTLEGERRPPGPVDPVEWSGRDDFDDLSLHPRWISLRRAPVEFASLDARPGWLTLVSSHATLDSFQPVFVGRRQQHHGCRVRTLIDAGPMGEGGLALFQDEEAHCEVAVVGDRIVARAHVGPFDVVLGEAPRPKGPVVLMLETKPGTYAPDIVCLGFENEGGFHLLAEIDGRYLSTEVRGGFVGRVVGMFAAAGEAAFDWFDYEITGAA